MLGCLRALDAELRERGGALVVRHGRPEEELPALAREAGADAVYWTSDVSPFARDRDRARDRGARRRSRAEPRRRQLRASTSRRRTKPVHGVHAVPPRVAASWSAATVHRAPARARGARASTSGACRSLGPSARAFDAGGRAGGAAGGRWLARPVALRRAPRRARRRHRPSVALPALGLPLARASSRSARRAAAGPAAFRPPAGLARLLRPRAAAPSRTTRGTSTRSAIAARSSGTTTPRLLARVAGGAHRLPARRRRRCASSRARAGCTTARGWSSARS